MSTMIPLPTIGLASNVLFIGFGAVAHIYPVMIRHIAPLPVNAARLLQVRKLVRGLKGAGAGELSIEALSPFMSHRTFKAGSHADVALAEGVRTAADMGALPVVAAARDEAAATSAAARSAGRAGRVNAP